MMNAREERRIEEYARIRDMELKRANETAARRVVEAEAAYKAELAWIETTRKSHIEAAFGKFERCQEGVMTFLSNKADRDRIEHLGLDLPFLHETNLFARPDRQRLASEIASKIAA